jgi:hypothetical protein
LFVADAEDTAELGALRAAGADVMTLSTGRRSFGEKINCGYHATDQPWIFTAADDLVFHRDWFSRALAWAKPEHGVIGTNDIGNPSVMCGQHSTHSLVRRSYIETYSGVVDMPNTVMYPGYGHEWVDTEFIGTAKVRGAFVMAFDSIVEHQHPAWDHLIERDATYRKGESSGPADRRLYDRRRPLWEPTPEPRLVHRAPRRMPVR